MKLSTKFMWILYCVIASALVSYMDIYFGWGLFQ